MELVENESGSVRWMEQGGFQKAGKQTVVPIERERERQ